MTYDSKNFCILKSPLKEALCELKKTEGIFISSRCYTKSTCAHMLEEMPLLYVYNFPNKGIHKHIFNYKRTQFKIG